MNASQIHVFDTYARSATGRILHFDVATVAKDPAKALQYARQWLAEIGEADAEVGQENCAYCHSEPTAPEAMLKDIVAKGYAIFPMEGCPR